MLGMLALAGLGLGLKAYGAHKATEGLDDNLTKVESYLSDYKDAYGDFSDLSTQYLNQAGDYMNRDSQINQDAFRDIQQTSQDFVSQQNRLMSRNMSSGGIGGMSGIAMQNAAQAAQQGNITTQDAMRQNLLANRGIGLQLQGQGASLLDKFVQHEKGYGETMAQGWLQNDQLKRQSQQAMYGGLGEGLLGFATGMM